MTLALDTHIHPQGESKKFHPKPRLGFLGVGWIGRHRMEALAASGLGEIAALADPLETNAKEAAKAAPAAELVPSLAELLKLDLDGIVIATPSALHAGQAIAALESGCAVFCQKPLGRTHAETAAVIKAAKEANRLLGVDLSYRFITGVSQMRRLVREGELGDVFAADLVFHNAYGPDKSWFYDLDLAGGGCVIDLGIHLVDLAFWLLGNPALQQVNSTLFAQGAQLPRPPAVVEDYASARLDLAGGITMQLACSWRLHAGCDAIISASFYGTKGGVQLRNLNGSFFDFVVERFHGTSRELLHHGPDPWGGRAAVDWLERLAQGQKYDPQIESLNKVAAALDAIYGR